MHRGEMHDQACRRRLWMTWGTPASALLAVLLFVSCTKPLPQALPPPPPPPPPPPHLAARPSLHAAWSFQSSAEACIATAVAGHTRLQIAVHPQQPIRLSVLLPERAAGKPVARFRGPAGTWATQGWHAGAHEFVFPLGKDMDSLSRALMLLSGGVLDLDSPEGNLPIVRLSPSGVAGQHWFSCARRLVI